MTKTLKEGVLLCTKIEVIFFRMKGVSQKIVNNSGRLGLVESPQH